MFVKNSILNDLSFILTKKDKIYFVFLVILSVVVSVVETFSLSMIMPFFSLITNIKLLESNAILKAIYKMSGLGSPLRFLFVLGIALILLIVIRAFVNTGYFYLLTKFSRTRYRTLANRIFRRYLSLPYLSFNKDSTSTLTQNILIEANGLTTFVYGILLIISEIFVIVMIYTVLVVLNWKIALYVSIFLLSIGAALVLATSKITKKAGERREYCQNQLLRTMNETFGNYRFLKFINNKDYISNRFYHASTGFVYSEAIFAMFSALPKIIMETLGISIIMMILLYVLYFYHDPVKVIPILSMYGIAFFRLMPSINRIMNSWTQILYSNASYKRVATELNRPIESFGDENISFQKEISIKNISFSYIENTSVLNEFSLEISKGTKVAFWGPNGSGKSTAMDIVSGLIIPNKGEILVDGRLINESNIVSWRSKIGYIPQQFYLFEGTIKENILCGREYDENMYEQACRLSGVLGFINIMESSELWVGENGNQLSGGQKQRVAIARALYGNPEILLLDEGTSALDKDAGQEIIKELFAVLKDKTIIMVTHKEEFLTLCDQVVRFG